MKATGIVRRVDDLGRICIPKEIRRKLHIEEGDALELFIEDNQIIYQKCFETQSDITVECAKFVRDNHKLIQMVNSLADTTTVVFTSGKAVTVKRNSADVFDLNVAICYAMKKVGITQNNPV